MVRLRARVGLVLVNSGHERAHSRCEGTCEADHFGITNAEAPAPPVVEPMLRDPRVLARRIQVHRVVSDEAPRFARRDLTKRISPGSWVRAYQAAGPVLLTVTKEGRETSEMANRASGSQPAVVQLRHVLVQL
jgi:hypothetical protein